jgi:hypothetical protein
MSTSEYIFVSYCDNKENLSKQQKLTMLNESDNFMQDYNKRPPLKDITSGKTSAGIMARIFDEPEFQGDESEGTQLN